MSTSAPERVTLRYDVPRASDDWTLSEEPVPESRSHDLTVDLLRALLAHWAGRTQRDAIVGRNIAVRWERDRPQIGVDPDVYVVEPPPPERDALKSLRLWEPGHRAPLLAIEVVSASNSKKDYASAPEKYAASGVRELWIFDPQLVGPKAHGGPVRLQIWSRDETGSFARGYAGDGPAHSSAIGAWLFVVDEGARLRIADDAAGISWWTTAEEAERTAKEAERTAKEAALRRIAELEAELARRGG
jgi:Uma2 family endonuclease